VDNVAPSLTISESIALAATTSTSAGTRGLAGTTGNGSQGDQVYAIGPTPQSIRVLEGTIEDGGQVRQMYAFVVSPSGNMVNMQVGRDGDAWWFDLTPEETGDYKVWINAVDEAGNAVTVGPFTVTIVQVLATSDSPTALGAATTLTATVLGGSGFTFAWDFGDGSPVTSSSSPTVSHQYPAVSTYTAIVTATKGSNVFTATTTVLVDEPISGLTVSDDGPTTPGDATIFTATITAGSNVSYTWEFGDNSFPMARRGPVVFHTYATTGTYTATVTAYNAVSVVTATTTVNVLFYTTQIYLPLIMKSHEPLWPQGREGATNP